MPWAALIAGLACLAVIAAPARASSLSAAQQSYLSIADGGISQTGQWMNHKLHWYNARLNDHSRYPLATIWDVVPLFEALDGVAIANPTAANRARVVRFAHYAERYWDRPLRPAPGYAPYPGDGAPNVETWFDDNGWLGLAFMDAYRVTGKHRYLADAVRAFRFIASSGWDSSAGGMWWNTYHTWKSGEALGAATDLGARLYQATGDSYYLGQDEKFISWADNNLLNGLGFFSRVLAGVVPMPHDAEGAMIDSFETLCVASHQQAWCNRAESLAGQGVLWFLPLDNGPQYDAIFLRALLALYAQDHQALWYSVVAGNAQRILQHARLGSGLFLLGWDGSTSIPGADPDMLRTDAASVSVFAWLAATPPPS